MVRRSLRFGFYEMINNLHLFLMLAFTATAVDRILKFSMFIVHGCLEMGEMSVVAAQTRRQENSVLANAAP